MSARAPLALIAIMTLLGGCAATPPQASPVPETAPPLPAIANADEIAVALGRLAPATDAVFVLDDGLDLPVAIPINTPDSEAIIGAERSGIALVWIHAGRPDDRTGWTLRAEWTVRTAQQAPSPGAEASWFALVPPGSLLGLDRVRVGPELLAVRRTRVEAIPRDHAATADDADSLLADAARDPRLRWRVAIARSLGVGARAMPALDDPALEAYSRAIEARTRVALDRLAAHDPVLADRLARTLSRVVEFDGGELVPAFPPDDDALNDVVAVLLDERLPPAIAADRAAQYLDTQPRALAWVIDDAGGPAGARLGVAELAGNADLVSARATPVASCDPPTLDALLARRVTIVSMRCRESPSLRTVEVASGEWSTRLEASLAPARVSPPGLRIGPLLPEHAMVSWLASSPPSLDARWASAALLQRRAGSDSWALYLECLVDPARASATSDATDEIRFLFGSHDDPRATLVVREGGAASILSHADPFGRSGTPVEAVVRREDDRWVAFVDLPEGVLEEDGSLLLGVVRRDPRGVRTTWPRQSFPWEDSLSRLWVDVSAWPATTRRQDDRINPR